MTLTKMERKAVIVCAMAYYDVFCGYPVFKIQLRYDDLKAGENGRYQAIVFQFAKESELRSCVEDFKAICGFKYLTDIKNRSVDVWLYEELISKYKANIELTKLVDKETKRTWLPQYCGIADALTEKQTLFVF